MRLGSSLAWDGPGGGGYPALSGESPKQSLEQTQASSILWDREMVGLKKGHLMGFPYAGERGTRQAHKELHRGYRWEFLFCGVGPPPAFHPAYLNSGGRLSEFP